MSAWTALLEATRGCFRAPSFALFTDLLVGWVCAPGRRTITAMIAVADPAGRRAHDAYHRFVRDGAWAMSALWRFLAVHAVGRFAAAGVVALDCDDTLFHKAGRHIDGAGVFRDAVRSTVRRVVYALGLNLVVVTLRVSPPWGGPPLALPVNARLHKKNDTPSTVEHAAAMIRELAGWLPDRQFHLCADGAYASLCGAGLPRTHVTSRMRRDAALYEPAPPRTGKRGRPRTKGDRLPTPAELANKARNKDWQTVQVDVRGRTVRRLVCVRDVLWYAVNKHDLLRLVIVRDPAGIEPDDFFVTTDLSATGGDVASRYAGRWSIEVCFRDVKQDLGGEDPQSWKRDGPERAACLSLWLQALVWCWYLDTHPTGGTWIPRPWYPTKSGRTGGLPRRSPLRTARAAFTAGSSSKPQGQLRIEAPCSCVGRRRARGGFDHRPVSRVARGGRDSRRLSPCGLPAATSVPILRGTPVAARRTAPHPRTEDSGRPAW